MITDAAISISEYVANLGLDVAKDQFKEKIDEKMLRSKLAAYIESQRKYNEICSLSEEIDFYGLVEFVQNNLLNAVDTRVFNSNSKKRGQARREIISAATAYSQANTEEAKSRVSKCIANCLDIIRGFYESRHLSIADFLLTDMIVDAVLEEVKDVESTTIAEVHEAREKILSRIDSTGSLFSIDKAISMAEIGEVDAVGKGIKKILDHISLEHPYHPYFGYDYRNGMIISKPLTDEANKLYPPKIVLTGTVKIGSQYYNNPNGDPLNYAYRHQTPIIMEVSKATKFLGERPDPNQNEVSVLVGHTIVATPPQFPPAFPCSIKAGDKSFYDYVLLRTQEIEDDGTYIISNKEQGCSFCFEIRINPNIPRKTDFTVNISNSNNRDRLNYLRFVKTLLEEKDLHIYILSCGEDLIAGYINDVKYRSGFSSIEEEIDFLERICAIEDYFQVHLSCYGEINNGDYHETLYISDLIRNNQVMGTWSDFSFNGIMSQHFREELTTSYEKPHSLSYVGVRHIDLFGAEFELRFMRTFKCAIMVDIDKARKKAEVLDDGENFKISFRAGDDKSVIDTLKIPEQFDSVS